MDASTPAGKLISDLIYLGGDGIACVAYLYAGVRLHLLSRRTGEVPEYLIAVSFLFWVASYTFYDIPYAVVRSEALIPAVCSYGSLIALALGNVAFALFIRSVFRRDSWWATWLVGAIVVSLVAGLAGTAWIGDWEGIDPLANPWYWLEYFGSFAPYIWIAAEGCAQHLKARRRLKLGLVGAMACNRFLLWGIAGLLWVILESIRTANDFVNALTGQWSELLNFGIAAFEVIPVAIIWCAFFPPEFYRRWVEGRATPEEWALPGGD